ncbi:MAG TPA: N-acetyltransferase [Chloroflexi bacterium]|nr:N-acetyltransferase [Chloroflexota bacterium]
MPIANAPVTRIAELEWANYAATQVTAQVTPGLDVTLREDVVITTSQVFPSPDANHACLLRTTPPAADGLIAEIVDHFQSQGLPPTIFLSPACTPADLAERLLARGFVRQEEEEAWVVLENLRDFEIPALSLRVQVRPITADETLTYAQIFVAAFELPDEFAPYLAQLLAPSVGLPAVRHYLALLDGQPVGILSLLCYEGFGVIGSGGVLPAHRRSGAAFNLTIQAGREARERGIDTLMGQTAGGAPLERLLRISGFKTAFTRTCYTLP